MVKRFSKKTKAKVVTIDLTRLTKDGLLVLQRYVDQYVAISLQFIRASYLSMSLFVKWPTPPDRLFEDVVQAHMEAHQDVQHGAEDDVVSGFKGAVVVPSGQREFHRYLAAIWLVIDMRVGFRKPIAPMSRLFRQTSCSLSWRNSPIWYTICLTTATI
jgi:hypothetical protein